VSFCGLLHENAREIAPLPGVDAWLNSPFASIIAPHMKIKAFRMVAVFTGAPTTSN
jgi:hypothetical protein